MKKLLCIALSLVMLLAFAACGAEKEDSTEAKEATGLLSSFTAETLDGKKADQSIFDGKKVTMVNIWATFCGPCRASMPDLQKLHKDYKKDGFQVVGIVCDVYSHNGVYDSTSLTTAKEIVKETGVSYKVLLPSDDLNRIKLNSVSSVPETFFVDENGAVIAGPFIGSRSYEDWAMIIEGIL
ncbi:MAG: TlpA family protein disulfide reductase [Clostridia bacterium]|nr:TlpA family protein disulfide reductase [Clostridia bacterium]